MSSKWKAYRDYYDTLDTPLLAQKQQDMRYALDLLRKWDKMDQDAEYVDDDGLPESRSEVARLEAESYRNTRSEMIADLEVRHMAIENVRAVRTIQELFAEPGASHGVPLGNRAGDLQAVRVWPHVGLAKSLDDVYALTLAAKKKPFSEELFRMYKGPDYRDDRTNVRRNFLNAGYLDKGPQSGKKFEALKDRIVRAAEEKKWPRKPE